MIKDDDVPLNNVSNDPVSIETEVKLRERIKHIIFDFRDLVETELGYYRARFIYSQALAKRTIIQIAVALFALFGTIVAFILGTLLILASFIGPLFATICITFTFATVTIYFAILARRNSRNFSFKELDDE